MPRAGFGKVWREHYYAKAEGGLGFATGTEHYALATVQRFENATAFYFPDTGEVYVLFDPYTYTTRTGDSSNKVWFLAE